MKPRLLAKKLRNSTRRRIRRFMRYLSLGPHGERVAARYLRRTGAVIWKQNWRSRAGEIDLVAIHNHTALLVEVKTRTHSRSILTPFDQIHRRKQARMRRTAQDFIMHHRIDLRRRRIRQVRIDGIGIVIKPGSRRRVLSIEHVEDLLHLK